LPSSIIIRHASVAPADFHPQHNVIQKTYWYHFFLQRPLPFAARYGLFVDDSVSLTKLENALQLFVGTHDFRSFCSGYDQESTVRTIDEINLVYLNRFRSWRIEFKGERFLRYMIRRITGAALDVASRPHLPISTITALLAAKNQRHTLANAPAHGLMLAKIRYRSSTQNHESNYE
jgi:tRNA pseudouridine38-40 synthase